jgi:hypothetical protein
LVDMVGGHRGMWTCAYIGEFLLSMLSFLRPQDLRFEDPTFLLSPSFVGCWSGKICSAPLRARSVPKFDADFFWKLDLRRGKILSVLLIFFDLRLIKLT